MVEKIKNLSILILFSASVLFFKAKALRLVFSLLGR